MATMNFPTSPAVNDTYSFGGATWIWNGNGWAQQAALVSGLPSQTGNSGKYLTTDGTDASWGNVAAGGASFPVGAVVGGPSAPVDGGTWLECNGQSVEQATYPALYSAIGQDYARYKLTRMTTKPTGFTTAASFLVHSGTAWLHLYNSNTAVGRSIDDGTTWSAATSMPGVFANVYIATDNQGSVYVHGGSATTMYKTTNDGASWTTLALPLAGAYYWGFNGANNIVIGTTGSSTIYYSTNGGSNWTSATLPTTAGTGAYTILWTGTKWMIITNILGNNVTKIFSTTDPTGATGWTVTYPAAGMRTGNTYFMGDAIMGTGTIAFASATAYAMMLSNDGGLTMSARIPYVAASTQGPTIGLFWNGQHFISTHTIPVVTFAITAAGNFTSNLIDYGTNTGLGGTLTLNMNNFTTNRISFGRTNLVTKTLLMSGTENIATGGAVDYIFQIKPTAASTQFCVPSQYPSFAGGIAKSWIKAL